MLKKTLLTLTFCVIYALSVSAQQGKWKAYMAYRNVENIESAGQKLFVLASKSVFRYDLSDKSVTTYDKANGLNDCSVSQIAWCTSAKRLLILYENNNIDLLADNGDVMNISDYRNKSMTTDKTVNSIYVAGNSAYLCNGFGIVKLNMKTGEISDTYRLGFRVDYAYIKDARLYASSSSHGLWSALLTANLYDKSQWKRVGEHIPHSKMIDKKLLKTIQNANPGGPKYNNFGFMRHQNGRLYTVGGGFTSTEDMMRPGTVQVLDNGNWHIYQDENISQLTGYQFVDNSGIDIDPRDNKRIFVSGRTGVYEFYDGKFVQNYNNNVPVLKTASTVPNSKDKNYVIVQSIKFDTKGNLWALNSISPSTSLVEYNTTGKWLSHHNPALMYDEKKSLENMKSMIFDTEGLLWFANDYHRTPSLFCYNTSTDRLLSFKSFTNQDGTTVNVHYARCLAEDKEHHIWIGTDVGPLLLKRDQINNTKPVFTQIKVPRNDGTDYADYLLNGIDITCVAVDGANRKWFGTQGDGVYLISSNHLTQIHHFTADNSPLLSNNIESIAIDGNSGEVYFGTENGLCSYLSDATEPAKTMTKNSVYAYPNPVHPDYNGPITITGLTYDADIKIVTASGILVNQGRSNGGIYRWDGTDHSGKRVSSGVYMVQTATQEGKKGTVCKIVIIN